MPPITPDVSLNTPPSLVGSSAAEVLRRLQLMVDRRLDGMLQGDYRGLVPGHGSELGETREYQPGDDVRRIDWNVTARTQTPHVRDTIADRELETWLLTDVSASLDFGTARCEKRDLAVAAAAAIGFLTAHGGNRFGAVISGGPTARTMPARSGQLHTMALLRMLVDAALADGSQATLEDGIHRLSTSMRRRGLAVVISDFLDTGDWQRPLHVLSVRHEVLAIEIIDPRELELPDVGVLDLVDPETGATLEVQTSDAALRARYALAAAAQRADHARRIRAAGADHLVLRTDRDWLLDLVRFVAGRRDRIDSMTRARS